MNGWQSTRTRRVTLAAMLSVATVLIAPQVGHADNGQDLAKAPPEQVGMSTQRLARISAIFKRDVDQGKLPGAVMMVARKGKLVFAEAVGFQDKNAARPMSLNSIFRVYSMSKSLTSVAAMTLVEDGTIQLADPISKYLPAFKRMVVSVPKIDPALVRLTYTMVPAEREITIQDLLRHTAGLAYGELTTNTPVRDAYVKAGFVAQSGPDFDIRGMTADEQVERLSKAPLATQPGAMWEYSIAVDVLGRVLEAATGKRLSEVLDERLFKPLKMADTSFWVPKNKIDQLAQPLPVDPITGLPNILFDMSTPPKNDSGGAGIASTATDYLRFAQMLLNKGQLDGMRLLSPTTVRLMTADHLGTRIDDMVAPVTALLGTPGYTFGLGFAVRRSDGIVGEPGSAGEFLWTSFAGSFFWIDPKEQIVAVYMTQSPGPLRGHYRRLFKQLVYQAVVD